VLGLKSKPEPFLQEAQKKFGTHASFNRARTEHWCRAEGSPPAWMAALGTCRFFDARVRMRRLESVASVFRAVSVRNAILREVFFADKTCGAMWMKAGGFGCAPIYSFESAGETFAMGRGIRGWRGREGVGRAFSAF
jgi:hypothetical protein